MTLAAFFGTTLLFSLSERMETNRHIATLAFLPLFLIHSNSFEETSESPALSKPAVGLCAFLIFYSLVSGFKNHFLHAVNDAKIPYSEAKLIASFLIENGYDAPDAMIISPDSDIDSVIKAYMPRAGAFLSLDNGIGRKLTYAAWQLKSDEAPRRAARLADVIDEQTQFYKDDYRAIIFLAQIITIKEENQFGYKLLRQSQLNGLEKYESLNVYLAAENGVITK